MNEGADGEATPLIRGGTIAGTYSMRVGADGADSARIRQHWHVHLFNWHPPPRVLWPPTVSLIGSATHIH